MMLVGNPNGVSGVKLCRPEGTILSSAWLAPAHLTVPPLSAAPNAPNATNATNATAPVATVPPPVHILGAMPPLAKGGPVRPACASRGKALNDPLVQTLNGGYVLEATDCQSRCALAPTCVFWTFYNDTGGCWLQGANVTTFPNISAISGPKLCDEPVKASRYAAGHNITGADQLVMMRSIPRPLCSFRGKAYRDSQIKGPNGGYLENAKMCQEACARGLCSRFTYYIDTKACWLQGENVTEFESPMAIAGPKECDEPHQVSLKEMELDAALNCAETKVARQGDELIAPEFMVKSDAVECQVGCQSTSNCSYFSYYPETQRCTLHGKNAIAIAWAGSVSGPKACNATVAMPLSAWEVQGGPNATATSSWRGHPVFVLMALVAASCVTLLTALVCTRKSQVFVSRTSYRHLGPNHREGDLDEGFMEAP